MATLYKRYYKSPGGSINPPAGPQHYGHTFRDWTPRTYTNVTADMNIYSNYDLNTYVVTFQNRSAGTSRQISVLYGGTVQPPTTDLCAAFIPERTGYTFTWDRDNFTNITANLTSVGDYVQRSDYYWVQFFGVDGNLIQGSRQLVAHGESAVEPTYATTLDPLRYVWAGWDRSFSNVVQPLDIHAKTEPLKDEITIRSKSKTSTIKASSFHGGFSARTADAKRIFNDASVEMRKVLEITDCSNQITAISERGLNKSCYLKGNLEKVSFPGLIKVFSEAFSDRKYLTCVNAPNITTIEKKGFKNCSRLGQAIFPKCTSIGESAFEGCNYMDVMNLSSCTSIGKKAFSGMRIHLLDIRSATDLPEKAFQKVYGPDERTITVSKTLWDKISDQNSYGLYISAAKSGYSVSGNTKEFIYRTQKYSYGRWQSYEIITNVVYPE